jgi:futalosine hydrolase
MESTLLLIPTHFELECFSTSFHRFAASHRCAIQLCGFGPVLSGIIAARLLAQYNPEQVLLAGIAGSLDPKLVSGDCLEFDEVLCYGIGSGSGNQFVSAGEMGWCQWRSEDTGTEIRDTICLRPSMHPNSPAQLLTSTAAAANATDVRMRLEKHPAAQAEDMEGFAVAAACKLAQKPLRILRGISNLAGVRDKSLWRVGEAMASVEKALVQVLS